MSELPKTPHEQNLAKIEDNADEIAKVESATFDWSSFLSTPIGKAVGGLAVTMLMFAVAWITDKMKPPVPVPVPQPGVVIVQPTTPTVDPASPIVPPTAMPRITLYVSTKEQAAIGADPSLKGVAVHPSMFPAGSTYPFAGRAVPVPCAEVKDAAGKVLDVREFASVGDVAAMMKKEK